MVAVTVESHWRVGWRTYWDAQEMGVHRLSEGQRLWVLTIQRL